MFGLAENRLTSGAAHAIHEERLHESFPKTVIVRKAVDDFNALNHDNLASSRLHGQSQSPRSPDYTYGYKNDTSGWNAAKCLSGEPSER